MLNWRSEASVEWDALSMPSLMPITHRYYKIKYDAAIEKRMQESRECLVKVQEDDDEKRV